MTLRRPDGVHGRVREWGDLAEFATDTRVGATLGLVYGRRRQGKTFLLQSLVEATGGLLYGGLQMTEAQNLDRFALAYASHRGLPSPPAFRTWDAALDAVFQLGEDGGPVGPGGSGGGHGGSGAPPVVVIDEFPYLMEAAPGLPSIVQAALSPRGRARTRSRTRLILCGSALTTMQGLMSGGAPLRGRAAKELMVHPFGYRDAAEFWGVADDPELAFRLHALVGGTPAYRDMSGRRSPTARGFDRWVESALLGPGSAMFREGNVLLQAEVADTSLYHSVLSAIADGAHRRSEIGGVLRRPDSALSHPLTTLEHTRLVERVEDALRPRRPVYGIAEPVIRLHQLVIRRNEAALVAGHADEVWRAAADTVASKIHGPHLEGLAREWCLLHASTGTLGGRAGHVRPATVLCREHGQGHEIDVVVTATPPFAPEHVVAIGEVKATAKAVGTPELDRLDHVRRLLPSDRVSSEPRLLLVGRGGFTADLRRTAAARHDVELVDLARLYRGD